MPPTAKLNKPYKVKIMKDLVKQAKNTIDENGHKVENPSAPVSIVETVHATVEFIRAVLRTAGKDHKGKARAWIPAIGDMTGIYKYLEQVAKVTPKMGFHGSYSMAALILSGYVKVDRKFNMTFAIDQGQWNILRTLSGKAFSQYHVDKGYFDRGSKQLTAKGRDWLTTRSMGNGQYPAYQGQVAIILKAMKSDKAGTVVIPGKDGKASSGITVNFTNQILVKKPIYLEDK